MVKIDLSGAKEFTPEVSNEQKALDAIRMLKDGSGAGSDFIGWVDLPVSYDKDEFARIQKAAKKNPVGLQGPRRHRHRRQLPGRARGH